MNEAVEAEHALSVEDQVRRYQEFIEKHYRAKLAENVRRGQLFIVVDFSTLTQFDLALAELLLEEPEESIKAFEVAVQQFDLGHDLKEFRIRLTNLPESQRIMISEIRSKDLNKLFTME